jgi:hypothetical protein
MKMRRLIVFASSASLAMAVAVWSHASPLDTATACAGLYQAQVQKYAIADGKAVPFQWIRKVSTKSAVVLDLEIFWPSGTRIYAGFRCHILANGTLVADQGDRDKSDH